VEGGLYEKKTYAKTRTTAAVTWKNIIDRKHNKKGERLWEPRGNEEGGKSKMKRKRRGWVSGNGRTCPSTKQNLEETCEATLERKKVQCCCRVHLGGKRQ